MRELMNQNQKVVDLGNTAVVTKNSDYGDEGEGWESEEEEIDPNNQDMTVSAV